MSWPPSGRTVICRSAIKPAPRAGALLRHLRAGLPAERAGDRLPARSRGRGGRAARLGVGRARAQVRGGARGCGPARLGRGPARGAPAESVVRHGDRRLSRPPRHGRGETHRAREARRAEPARLALRHARRRPRAVRAGVRRRPRPAADRPRRVPVGRPRRRRHGRPGGAFPLARRAPGRGLPRRRRGARLRPRLAGRRAVPVRGEADPAARARDDPRRGPARAGAPDSRCRERSARAAARGAVRRTSRGFHGSTTSCFPPSCTEPRRPSGSSAGRKRPRA